MNKREISEIKKQFKKDGNAISRICGCYVDADKQIRTTLKEAFFALSEEEIFKYYELFRKTLSGSLGKNLHNLEYSIHDEGEGSAFSLLMKLRDDKLVDDETVNSFYNKVIENYDYGENYYIILIHGSYDIPGRAADHTELFDASDEVYNHILCCICPVKLSEPGLSYNEAANVIEERPRNWWVQPPMTGFLFPAFNDRSTDLHSLLYFSKNPEELHYEFIDACLGAAPPVSFQSQKEVFQSILTDTLGEECEYGIVRQIHENLAELSEEHKEDMEPLCLRRPEVKGLLEKSGVEPERLERFDQVYEGAAGEDTAILVPAITGSGKLAVKTPDVDIRINPNRLDLVETRLLEGRRFLVIAIEEHVEVNGIPVKLWDDKKEE
ncbi:MAG: DUF4317 domain-containing protein [Lachnospiraceae bacterium]|nr:DUF4317 domain-containing protein [Lachnospiraceae bacterium]